MVLGFHWVSVTNKAQRQARWLLGTGFIGVQSICLGVMLDESQRQLLMAASETNFRRHSCLIKFLLMRIYVKSESERLRNSKRLFNELTDLHKCIHLHWCNLK